MSVLPRSVLPAGGRRFRFALPVLTILWLLACIAGLVALWRYKTTPADDGSPPTRWPADSAIARVAGQPTLFMLVHPRCPCSRASLSELNQVMNRVRGVTATVVFVLPDGAGDSWLRGESWDRAHQIPGTRVLVDRGGAEARRFRVSASGHTLLYGSDGELLYSGGVTGARGHEGDNAGRRQLLARLTEGAGDPARSRVYGCGLAAESR